MSLCFKSDLLMIPTQLMHNTEPRPDPGTPGNPGLPPVPQWAGIQTVDNHNRHG